MERRFEHVLVFDAKDGVSAREVAHSILANDQIIRKAAAVISECYPDLDITSVNVIFGDAAINSPLKVDLVVAIFAAFQDDIKQVIPRGIEAMFGVEIPAEYRSLVTLVVLLVAVYGIDWVYKRLTKKGAEKISSDERGTTINGNYNTVLNVAAPLLDKTPEALNAALERAIPPKERGALAKSAVDLIRPARSARGSVRGAGVEISAETVAAAPSDAEIAMLPEVEEDHDQLSRQRIVLHAWDMDRGKTGWGGILEGYYDKRIRLQLMPGIRPEQYAGVREIIADLIVLRKENSAGELTPYLAIVTDIHES